MKYLFPVCHRGELLVYKNIHSYFSRPLMMQLYCDVTSSLGAQVHQTVDCLLKSLSWLMTKKASVLWVLSVLEIFGNRWFYREKHQWWGKCVRAMGLLCLTNAFKSISTAVKLIRISRYLYSRPRLYALILCDMVHITAMKIIKR